MTKITEKIIILVEAEFGSEFQQVVATDALAVVIRAWQIHFLNSHKKNKIKIKFDDAHKELLENAKNKSLSFM